MKPAINLTIRRRWLDAVVRGEKREEYRDWTNVQVERLFSRLFFGEDPPPFLVAVYRAGYRMDSPACAVRILRVELRGARECPHPEWGERRGLAHFAVVLGDVLASGPYSAVKAALDSDHPPC
jgi:hypothetical protein